MVLPLIGYADRFSAKPGETVRFMVSSLASEPYVATLVRLVCADPNPDGPGSVEVDLSAVFRSQFPSRPQTTDVGSRANVTATTCPYSRDAGVSVLATIWPTTPQKGLQDIISVHDAAGGFALSLGEGGRLQFRWGRDAVVRLPTILRPRRFYRVWASFSPLHGVLSIDQLDLDTGKSEHAEIGLRDAAGEASDGVAISIAAAAGGTPRHHYNGKIERPAIASGGLTDAEVEHFFNRGELPPAKTVACWDFSRDIPGTIAYDTGPNGLDAQLVNLPARAMLGSNWSGREMSWRHAPDEYGAIHFHDDDLGDAGWEADFSWTVPADLASGIYAMRLDGGGHRDHLVFAIRPAAPTATLALLLPTLTYQTYANFARPENPELRERISVWGVAQNIVAEHPEYGLSMYNKHSDTSGVCHASSNRPLLELRPGQLHTFDPKGSGLLHFNADLHIIKWLEDNGIAYDVLTDHDLHREGPALLAPYQCVMTGSHPEYHTSETLDGIEHYVKGGGNLIYMGANGFYWRVCFHRDLPDVIELRRAEGGVRSWASEPGEYYHAFDGTYGGLWRRLNRPPQRLVGVGFSSQGDYSSSYYRRSGASYGADAAWLMDGIEDEIIGDFGYFAGGAAGLELDRADPLLGTPDGAIVIASSEGHSDAFRPVNEEMETQHPPRPLPELIRADVTYSQNGAGQVFAVGSMNFAGSLLWNGGDNNVSRLLLNVLGRFNQGKGL
ncbi:N,N-dimethylformamidase beta subunit family domain-containing protein [Chelatococcus asaccharovorans]|uniref:N,N-dimethylformamidase n=1 Tax=Chelatococcus asaccharovorans TaxID=28210 RepID=A0A2V3U5Y2_9HYPH|nr:N,N-dimethylformamidase beta subunit family domain-containing protein [Chelatococcus asaccharovorans]MBS7703736.1 N,N-dimethylformamidase [Chelatococcus asaccharovorans]PXW57894.1 N,N-dimethylformamidase [Chelatococcus asaccharovorans]